MGPRKARVAIVYDFALGKDIRRQLLELILAVARAIEAGEAVSAPGVLPKFGDAGELVTPDGIQP